MFVTIRRGSQLGLALAFLVLTLTSPLRADETAPWNEPLKGDPKAIAAAAEMVPAQDAPVIVLLDEATYVLDAQGKSTGSRHLVYRIVAEAGIEGWSTIEAPYSPWYQDKPEIRARVITRDGTTHDIDPKAFGDQPLGDESDIFSDNRVVRGPLPAVGVGSTVEQLITYRDRNPFPEAGSSQRFYFGRYVPVHEARMTIEYPSSVAVKTVNHTTPPQVAPVKSEKDGITRVVFAAKDLKALENLEWYTPSDESQVPYIGFSSGKSWQEIARRYSEIVDKQIATSSVKDVAKAAVGDAKDPHEIAVRALAAIEKDIRYAGVEFGEHSIVPHPPQEVLSNKYGDCKDKATLLVAMLRESGVPAHVVLLKAGENLDVSADITGISEFNHAIVVTDGPNPIWIDPTDEFARAGELPIPDQGRMALIARPGSTTLTLTPVAPSSANRIVERRQFTLAEEGKARVVETNEPTGGDERTMRRSFAQADQKKYREGIESYVQNAYGAKSLGKFEASDPHDLDKPFRLTLEAVESQRGVSEDGEAAVGIFLNGLTGDLPFPLQSYEDENPDATDAQKAKLEKKKRVHDFVFPESYVKEWHYTIVAPPGFTPRPLPENGTQKLGPATLTKEFQAKPDGSVEATFRFDTVKRRITAAEFDALRKGVHELDGQKALLISFDQIGKLRLNEGNVGGALSEYHKLVDLHPTEARHHVEIARALLAGGMGEAARAEIKRAIEIEPTAKAYRMLGIIMQHDLVGRPFHKGFNLPAAVAAYRKAKELDPKDVQIRAELSDLLEYGDDGGRFGKGAKLNDAIDELLSIKKELKNERVDQELMQLYARSGRYVELRELTKVTKDVERKDTFRIAAVAAIDGSPAALRDSETIDQSKRRGAIEGAAGLLAMMRLYPQAADLFAAAAQGASNAAELRSRAEAMRKTKRVEEMQIADDPQGVVKRMMLAVAKNDFDDDAATPFLTRDARELYIEAGKEITGRKREGMQALKTQDDGVPSSFIADFAISNLQLVQDGSEEVGYRIKVRSTYTGQPGPDDTVWVIREEGKYKVAATGDQLGALGVRALRLADAGKLEAARQWLDWAREIIQIRGSDDPLASPPFAYLWTRGKQGSLDEARLAAAALMPQSKKAAELALPILKAARAKSELEETKVRIDLSLAGVYSELEDWTSMLEVSKSLAAKYPDSLTAFGGQVEGLRNLDRRDEIKALANDRLKRLANDKDALRVLAADAASHAEYEASSAYYQKIIDSSDPTSIDYNNKAWNALFTMKDIAKAIEDARQSVEMRGTNPEALHTLAALYAEEGKTSEARDSLLKSMDSSGEAEPQSHDWYVFGRIAENYGVTDAAVAAYGRVEKPKKDLPGSTYVLAQHRLDGLKKK